ncbi:uncharacterized protein KY384_000905 [Bacidia gigantensis]|uniref:uncharacterized protein n=1 Tax=Bacidia gigantensis TaxID=2732470 RepID=UPI001D05303D|nr:uncharacterized protein KY384_000905 [Bacidia gigantensis]KAG8534062.1 hypothetical protein KY384_000905 [Bacidia gigantensis]
MLWGVERGFLKVMFARSHTRRRSGSKLLEWKNQHAKGYAKHRYGPVWGRCLACFAKATVERLVRLEHDVIGGEDADLVAFKLSLAGELSMVAVAVSTCGRLEGIEALECFLLTLRMKGALIAQIAEIGFSLPNNLDIHWIVRAFFVCGLVMGLLSVYFSVIQQRTLGKLHKPSQVRVWLLANSSTDAIAGGTESESARHEASFATAFLTQLPYTTIEYGVIFLVIGIALYLGLSWQKQIDKQNGEDGDRNVLIMYVAVTGVAILQWAWALYSKSIWMDHNIMPNDHEQGGEQLTHVAHPPPHPRLESRKHASDTQLELGSMSSESSNTLAEVLRQAAEIHRQCAEKDILVAEKYERGAAHKRSL